ncbi:2-oxo acid dehydrogenase subunit E2 [Clostridium swellfunianum]|uniref:dihydrolipoamide acetyltransferase family protein n=1 Tax=Clostridium swellfunianum TaxID=1367462 RepID=UPI0020301EAD|nr:dihydrolipoamide acetyltransferase family protein [Clostridium swellfunianum]MCM0649521.1 2-oxo acid dehydrogenase subunit E2 [Clostridium swellfunianum]
MIEFKFPDIGEGIAEGKLLKWVVKVGDKIKEGESLFLVETDKVNAEIPSPADGTIAELMAKEGDIINVGGVIVKIDNGEPPKESDLKPINEKQEENAGVVGAIEVSSEVIASSFESYKNGAVSKHKVLATPVARQLAKDLGIDINTVKGTGAAGRVMKEDIYKAKEGKEAAISQHETEKVSGIVKQTIEVPKLKISGEVERISLSMLRKAIAKNMTISKQVIPHAAVLDEFDVTKLVEFKASVKELVESSGVHLTYMPFIIKAIALTLKEFPVFNSSFDEEAEEIVLKKYYNLGVAVDTPDGLLVPVIKDVDKKGILDIARDILELSEGARNKNIPLEKLQNGTFTITNYGALGSSSGIPVIRHPEAAIIGIGKIAKKPIVNKHDEIVIRSIMNISLCIDHRIIDGGDAGRFLSRLKKYLEEPLLLLLG